MNVDFEFGEGNKGSFKLIAPESDNPNDYIQYSFESHQNEKLKAGGVIEFPYFESSLLSLKLLSSYDALVSITAFIEVNENNFVNLNNQRQYWGSS